MTDRVAGTLSILIPVFNWPVQQLVDELRAEIAREALTRRVDIHLFDDGSSPECAAALRALESPVGQWPAVKVHSVGRNVGRSDARNELLAHSTGDWVLFLDADVLPDSDRFISRYLNAAASSHNEAFCGGLSYRRCADVAPEERFYFRYSSRASVATPDVRNRRAWAWVFTSNMLVSRRLVQSCPFDPGFSGYGYEDLEWGIRLDQHGGVMHIDNAVTHLGLLTKRVLQRKTREAASNFARMRALHPNYVSDMPLMNTAQRLAWVPAGLLRSVARGLGWLFRSCSFGFDVNLLLFQAEKLLWTGLALRSARVAWAKILK